MAQRAEKYGSLSHSRSFSPFSRGRQINKRRRRRQVILDEHRSHKRAAHEVSHSAARDNESYDKTERAFCPAV